MIRLKKGDIVTYMNGDTNYINKEDDYAAYHIVKVQRYVKFLCFYRLKTIYEGDWIK